LVYRIMGEEGATLRCSFCNKSQDEVRKLVRGGPKNDTYICDECVDVCNDIIFGEAPSIIRPLRMAWRALRWWMTGRVPPGEQGPPTPN